MKRTSTVHEGAAHARQQQQLADLSVGRDAARLLHVRTSHFIFEADLIDSSNVEEPIFAVLRWLLHRLTCPARLASSPARVHGQVVRETRR